MLSQLPPPGRLSHLQSSQFDQHLFTHLQPSLSTLVADLEEKSIELVPVDVVNVVALASKTHANMLHERYDGTTWKPSGYSAKS